TALELFLGEKIVIAPFGLTGTRRPRRTRNRVPDILSGRQKLVSDGRLPAPGGRRENDGDRHYSRFSTCSRLRSSSSFVAITSSWIWASLALLPIVFASRTISWSMNPSLLPTGSAVFDCEVSRNTAR